MKVFISHSSRDKKFVRTLKDCLLENGIETWFAEDQLDVGDRLITKLENALNTSSHLVIILSPASVTSDWVTYELKKALSNQRTGLMQKIIPIKYRECPIPEELTDLLYADLSEEVVLPSADSERIRFISNGFDSFFLKLVRAIRNSSKEITPIEKSEILKSIKLSEEKVDNHSINILRGNYELVGYETAESKLKYQKIIINKNSNYDNTEDLRPFLLPSGVKQLFEPKIGEKIQIESNSPVPSYGHFAGYRVDDLKITLDKIIREELHIKSKQYYQVEIDPENRTIKFIDVISIKRMSSPPLEAYQYVG